jgi:hypothetical protein
VERNLWQIAGRLHREEISRLYEIRIGELGEGRLYATATSEGIGANSDWPDRIAKEKG